MHISPVIKSVSIVLEALHVPICHLLLIVWLLRRDSSVDMSALKNSSLIIFGVNEYFINYN